MSRQFWVAGIVTVGFLLACTGEVQTTTPASTPPAGGTPEEAPPDAEPEADAGEDAPGDDAGAEAEPDAEPEAEGAAEAADASCCAYDGPLGETHALVDSEADCTSTYADNNPRMVAGPQCVPVCCTYPEDPADLSKGDAHARVAAGNCTLRKGTVVDAGPDTCPEADAAPTPEPAARPRPKPKGKPVVIPPLKRPGGERGGTRPQPRPRPSGGSGGGLTRPGG